MTLVFDVVVIPLFIGTKNQLGVVESGNDEPPIMWANSISRGEMVKKIKQRNWKKGRGKNHNKAIERGGAKFVVVIWFIHWSTLKSTDGQSACADIGSATASKTNGIYCRLFFSKFKRKEMVFFWSRGIFTKIRLSKISYCTVHVLNAHWNNTSRMHVDCRDMDKLDGWPEQEPQLFNVFTSLFN